MVYVATVSNSYGTNCLGVFSGVNKTEAENKAKLAIWAYCKEWWDDVAGHTDSFDNDIPDDIPIDVDKAIALYFQNHEDGESYDISAHEIQ